ncbi:MAG: hypothetical protein KGS61_20220 [Verrucomicrobia bacterium]|nr:hypothetical protein [Verrucomicrobiota bacterium]
MLGIFKKIFAKEPAETAPAPTALTSARPHAAAPSTPLPDADCLTLPLKCLLGSLPQEIKPHLHQQPRGDLQVRVPLKTILDQLPRGIVRLTFAELKASAPPGVFADSHDLDQTPIVLPLPEVLSRLKPGQLPRRADQRRSQVPEDIRPIFGSDGKPLPQAAEAPRAVPQPAAVPPAEPVSPPAPRPPTPPTPIAAATIAPAIPLPPPSPSPVVAAPIKPIAPLPELPRTPLSKPAPAAVVPTKPVPVSPPPALRPAIPVPPAPQPAKPPPGMSDAATIRVALASVATGWPESVRQEISERNLAAASLALPVEVVAAGLKSGKLVFTWQQIRAWLPAEAGAAVASACDAVAVALPLPVVVPLFMAHRAPAAAQRRVVIGDNIPDLFTGTRMAPVPPAPTPAPPLEAGVPAAVPEPTPPPPVPAAPPPPVPAITAAPLPSTTVAAGVGAAPAAFADLGAALGQPGKKEWSPLEIVHRAAGLPGIAGVLIAMQDGLLVADQMPAELSAETFAAFVPQLFERLSHYTTELKLGEPDRVLVHVGGKPLEILKAGGVYLAVLGRTGQALPATPLAAIAAYLGQQTQ